MEQPSHQCRRRGKTSRILARRTNRLGATSSRPSSRSELSLRGRRFPGRLLSHSRVPMKRSADETTPVWAEQAPPEPTFSPLRQNTGADVSVVGAGIAGLTTAFLLQKEGRSVVVVDAFGLAAGETGRTTAHLTAVLDDRFSELESLFGVPGSRLAADSHRAAIDRIETIVGDERIDCDFERVNGYLVGLPRNQQRAWDKEIDAAQRAGFYDAEGYPRVPLPNIAEVGPALEFPRQAMFHPRKYMIGLAKAFEAAGGRLYARTRIAEVKGGADAHAMTDDGLRIDAGHIVVATNTPINDRVTMHTKQAAYRSYVVGFEIPKDSYPGFLLWDMADPYHYVRPMRGGGHDLLIVGGEDHKTGQARDMDARYRRLEEWTGRHFGGLGAVKYRWSGQVIEPVDSLAFIGRNPGEENVYIATGDSGHGMTHGTIAGMLIADLVQGRENPWVGLYDPARVTIKAARSFASENINAGAHLVKDWLGPGEVDSVERVARGGGALLRQGATKIAVYRGEQGAVHKHSAVCPHLDCIVQWNPNENSWDCPCHGSRFDCEGRVLNGPAGRPLTAIDAT